MSIIQREATKDDLELHRADDYSGWKEVAYAASRTLTDEEGNILAVVGIHQRWVGVADCWTVFTEHAREGHGLELLHRFHVLLNSMQEETNLARLNAWVRSDNEEYQRWARLCGFKAESVMIGGGPNNTDIIVYVRHSRWADYLGAAAKAQPQSDPFSKSPLPQSRRRPGKRVTRHQRRANGGA